MTNRLFQQLNFSLVLFISLLFLSVPNALARDAIGNWNWFNGGVVSILPDGSFKQVVNNNVMNSGYWSNTEAAGTKIRMNWSKGGWIDNLVISSDGRSMRGTNQMGGTVSATRAGGDEIVPVEHRSSCSLDTHLMSGPSDFCTSFAEYNDSDGRRATLYIVNDDQFQRGFIPPSTWKRARYNTCDILYNEECR